MRLTFYAVLLVCCLAACSRQEQQPAPPPTTPQPPPPAPQVNDLRRAALKGKVRRLTEYNYPSWEAVTRQQPDLIALSDYDSTGWLAHSELYLPKQRYTRVFAYQRRQDTLWVIDQVQQGNRLEKQQILRSLLQPNGNPKMTSYEHPQTGKEINRVEIDHTPQGQWTEKRHFPSRRTPPFPCKETRIYDKNNFPIADYIYTFDPAANCQDTPYRSQLYTNNAGGDKIQMIVKDINGKTIEQRDFKYKYDVAGNWTEQVAVNPQATITAIVIRELSYY